MHVDECTRGRVRTVRSPWGRKTTSPLPVTCFQSAGRWPGWQESRISVGVITNLSLDTHCTNQHTWLSPTEHKRGMTPPSRQVYEVMCWKHCAQRKCCIKFCFLLLCGPCGGVGGRWWGDGGAGRSWKLLGEHKEEQVALKAPSVHWAFTTHQGPVVVPVYALLYLILTVFYKVVMMHRPTLLTRKHRLRKVM